MCYNDFMFRKNPLVTGEVYHVMNKSIAGYKIFSGRRDYERMMMTLRFFTLINPPGRFSRFISGTQVQEMGYEAAVDEIGRENGWKMQIIAYSIMPTHLHIVAKQLDEKGISEMLQMALNSYARYFNTKYKRHGPLFVGNFKNVLVKSDEQLLHLTRYVHVNPVSAGLVDSPEDWPFSSYHEYIEPEKTLYPLAKFKGLVNCTPEEYRKFVEDYAGFQKELALIKAQIIE